MPQKFTLNYNVIKIHKENYIMITEIKENLLTTGIVKENEYLDKYCNLIVENAKTKYQVHKTQSHHIIPKYYCKVHCPSLIKDRTNKVNLLYKDHILAHYYLALCSANKTLVTKNVSALFKMTNVPQTEFEGSPIEFIENLDKYQELYEMYSVHQGDHLRGKKQSTDHIAQRVHKNTGQKRSLETRKKMSEWQKGKSKPAEAVEKMRISQLKYFQQETQEHKDARIEKAKQTRANWTDEYRAELSERLSKALKGRTVGENERLNKSLALSGKPKTLSHRVSLSRSKSKYRYIIQDTVFESTMEAREYLQSHTDKQLDNYSWNRLLNYADEVNGITIRRELK